MPAVFRSGPGFVWESRRCGLLPGMASLALFAYLLTKIDTTTAGRAYAAYGSVYIVSSICWLWAVEGARPDRWDVIGASVALVGAGIIVFGVRS